LTDERIAASTTTEAQIQSFRTAANAGKIKLGPLAVKSAEAAFMSAKGRVISVDLGDLRVRRLPLAVFSDCDLAVKLDDPYRLKYIEARKAVATSEGCTAQVLSSVITSTGLVYRLEVSDVSAAEASLSAALMGMQPAFELSRVGSSRKLIEIRAPTDTPVVIAFASASPMDLPALCERIPPPPKRLRVTFDHVDVYLDGSPGPDTWSTWARVNGQEYQLWNRKKDISDNGHIKEPKGPCGDGNASRYPLSQSYETTVSHDSLLEVCFRGLAHDQNDDVPQTCRTFGAVESWGIGNQHRMGGCNGGQTEYYVYFTIQELP
jgi:hypothetical protein